MNKLQNGFYTQKITNNVYAVIDGNCYYVAIIDGKKYISTEKINASYKLLSECDYQPFEI